jgi:hypothetical protein
MAGRQGGGVVSPQFAVVHEAAADFQTATELADRVLADTIDWLDEDQVEYQRTWLKEWAGAPLTWTRIKRSALEAGIDAIGFFEGSPAEPDARAARRAILYLQHIFPDLAAVVLIRDQDDEPERRAGLEQACRQETGELRVVVGLAIPKRECWVISGFEPENDDERQILAAETQALGSDPRLHSHDLTAKDNQATRSPKRVLKALTGNDWERQQRCWHVTPLSVLAERGQNNGLADYLGEIRAIVVPLIAGYRGQG